jgi:hypothetical protein
MHFSSICVIVPANSYSVPFTHKELPIDLALFGIPLERRTITLLQLPMEAICQQAGHEIFSFCASHQESKC